MAFIAVVGALAVFNLVAANPLAPHHHGFPGYPGARGGPCPKPPLPEITPQIIQQVAPAPVNIGPQAPGVIEHVSAPYEINYFAKPWIVKHQKSAALNVFSQTPVVVDEYAAPAVNEAAAPPAVIVEEVCPPVAAPPAPLYASKTLPFAAPAPVFSAPAPLPAPAPCN